MLNDRFMSIRQINMREELRMKKKHMEKQELKAAAL